MSQPFPCKRCRNYVQWFTANDGRHLFDARPVTRTKLGGREGYLPAGRGARLVPTDQAPEDIRNSAIKAFVRHLCRGRNAT